MGGSNSQQTPCEHDKPAPPRSPEFAKEWRQVNWNGRDDMERVLREFQLSNTKISHVRILLHGEVGAGKSSFINSVNSVFEHRITVQAGVEAEATKSRTKRFKTYKIKNGSYGYLPFVFSDVMGVEGKEFEGIHPDDVINALQGHVKEKHEFSPFSALAPGDTDYISNTSLDDEAHCLVNVVPAKAVPQLTDHVVKRFRDIRSKASDVDIPQVVLMTKIDEICPLVKQNLRKVYTSKKIKDKMEECKNMLGVPMNCIFPIKNYHEESDPNNDMDILILMALKQIVNFANDYLEDA